MNDYTPYRMTFSVHEWTHIPVRDEWQDPRHIFGERCFLRRDIKQWLVESTGGPYAILDQGKHILDHVIAFSQPQDASMFVLKWS